MKALDKDYYNNNTQADHNISKLKNIKFKLKISNTINTKTDKNVGIVIINKDEYVRRAINFIKNNNYRKSKQH